MQNADAQVVYCPACRGPADVIADFRIIGADRISAGPTPVAPARAADPDPECPVLVAWARYQTTASPEGLPRSRA
eukprot:8354948-Pyramimonas_sp.AAC.1